MAGPDTPRARLSASALSVAYGRIPVIEGLDLAVAPGAFTVLLGPNGSGKSTVLKALAGLVAARDGAVFLDGKPIRAIGAKALARRVGVLSQAPVAPEALTVYDLVRQGRYPHRSLFGQWTARDEDACAAAMALTATSDLRDRPLDQLSGGQRQRAWIAMALAQDTDILMLDEPTTFLDLAHQIEVLDLVRRLVRDEGKTVVAVVHDLNQAARYADTMVFIRDGRIVVSGPPGEVMTAQAIERVFDVPALVIADPVSGTPLCIPRARAPD